MDKFYSFHFRDQILTITMTFAMISFIIALLYKRLKRFKKGYLDQSLYLK